MLKFILIIFLLIVLAYCFKALGSRSKITEKTVWIDNGEVFICYKNKPPHFKNIQVENVCDEFTSCGFCKYNKHDDSQRGCVKYGVEYMGVGSAVKTVCDDFESSLGQE